MTQSDKAKSFNARFKAATNRLHALSFAACAHCGICNDSCHYYLATEDPAMTPVAKVDIIRRIYKQQNDWLTNRFPEWFNGGAPETDEDLEAIRDVVFGACTGCRRCTFNCPFGVDTAALIGLARSCLVNEGYCPDGITHVMDNQWKTGNQMAITKEEYIDTLLWVEEELQLELNDPGFKIPIDKEGADFVYLVTPREIKYDPRSLQAALKIFHLSGQDFTMGTEGWDNTNFGLFSGQVDLGSHMGKLAYTHATKLKVKRMVISECGHGFRATRWEAPNWSKAAPLSFEVVSILELMAELIKTKQLTLDASKNPHPVTYHDPCNLSRSAGITEEPRYCLQQACNDFREMTPNRGDSFCCTGGGGAMVMPEYKKKRLEVGKVKAESIRKTGAATIATACHNCVDGLTELNKHYNISYDFGEAGGTRLVPVQNVCEIVANALVIPSLQTA